MFLYFLNVELNNKVNIRGLGCEESVDSDSYRELFTVYGFMLIYM